MSKIQSIKALEILDSRGNPTVRVWVTLESGVIGMAAVPSGASTGTHEAYELRDGETRYGGKGVQQAVKNIEGEIARAVVGREVSELQHIDSAMCQLDGTEHKQRLGANAILGVSLACAHAAANEKKVPLYLFLHERYGFQNRTLSLPTATMNVVNGGRHADSGLSVQEFMIVPLHAQFRERIRIGAEVFHSLHKVLTSYGFATSVGDEGGFAPRVKKTEKALALLAEAIEKAGYQLGRDVVFATDIAASEFYKDGMYHFEGKILSSEQMIKRVAKWMKQYPFISIEDPLHEDDWDGWKLATKKLSKLGFEGTAKIVGDDFFVTNVKRLQRGITEKCANAILIKVNQIGTLSETMSAIHVAQDALYAISISHRSGETSDTTIADIAVAVGAEYIKTGSLSRSDRVEKYNRLLEIERNLAA